MSELTRTGGAGVASAADVVIIGGGPAGIAAAVRAAEHGARVVLLDEGQRAGGQIWRHVGRASLPRAARVWLERLDAAPVDARFGSTVFDVQPHPQRGWRVHGERDGRPFAVDARAVILATGARERFLPFPGWTLPGVFGAAGAQALLKSGMDVRGRRVVVAGSGPLLLPVAALLAQAGADVLDVLEQAGTRALASFAAGLWRRPADLVHAVRYRAAFRRARYSTSSWIARATGEAAVRSVTISSRGASRQVECDMLCVGYGLVPATELGRLAGCAASADGIRVDDSQQTSVPGIYCAGEPTGVAGVDAALVQGQIAALAAVARPPDAALLRSRTRLEAQRRRMERAFALDPALRTLPLADTLVCRCEDVAFDQLAGCGSMREAKLMCRAGMGPCQGRVCGPVLEFLFAWGPDTVRSPVLPVTIAALSGAAAPPAQEITDAEE